jgi:glutamine synthetase
MGEDRSMHAADLPRGAESPAALFERAGVRQVECLFPDMTGYPRGKLMPAAAFLAGQELRIAQAIAMQAVTGQYSEHPIFPEDDPDVRLVPDPATVRLAPWSPPEQPRALAIHDCAELDGRPCAFAPRSLLKAVLARYAERGLTPVVAPEIEFYLCAPCADPNEPLQTPVGRLGRREVGQSAFSLNMLDELAPFWTSFQQAIETLGIRADTWIHEVGRSQFEINLWHGDALAVADQAFLFKHAARETAIAHGMNAVFLAKPIAGQAGSSMHLHVSLVDAERRNVFSAPDGSEHPCFHHYIGGLQACLPELMLLLAPHVNSYRRFVRGSQAPIHLGWGHDNRSAGLRVPLSGPAARRIEQRVSGSDANPYLAIAATLAAGLAGLDERLPASAPLEANGYGQTHTLPRTAREAWQLLADSTSARRLLGDDFVTGFVAAKEVELDDHDREISAWERRYLLPQV